MKKGDEIFCPECRIMLAKLNHNPIVGNKIILDDFDWYVDKPKIGSMTICPSCNSRYTKTMFGSWAFYNGSDWVSAS